MNNVKEYRKIVVHQEDSWGFQRFLELIAESYKEGFRICCGDEVNNYTRATFSPFFCQVVKDFAETPEATSEDVIAETTKPTVKKK